MNDCLEYSSFRTFNSNLCEFDHRNLFLTPMSIQGENGLSDTYTCSQTSSLDSEDNLYAENASEIEILPNTNKRKHSETMTSTESTSSPSETLPSPNELTPIVSEKQTFRSVHHCVKLLAQSWGKVVAIHPAQFLLQLLQSRNYDSSTIPSDKAHFKLPTQRQLYDYDNDLLTAVRTSDLPTIKKMHSAGKSMSACNKFSESIVHMACRRASPEVVKYVVTHGGDMTLSDDFGRNALHDACWRAEPCFDVVALLMDMDPEVIRCADKRGATPLQYVRKEHWVYWCAFLYFHRDKYWPIKAAISPTPEV